MGNDYVETENVLSDMRNKILTVLDSLQKLKYCCSGTDYCSEINALIDATKSLSRRVDFDIACFYGEEYEPDE